MFDAIRADVASIHQKIDVILQYIHLKTKEELTMSKAHDDLLALANALAASAKALIADKAAAEVSLADISAVLSASKAEVDAAVAAEAAQPPVV